MKLLKVTHLRQTPGLCGPYSLKILLSYFGKNYPVKQLIKLTGATKKYGAEHEDLVKAAKKLDMKVRAKGNAKIRDLNYWVNRKKLPVIIGWFSDYTDHYAVVIGLDKKYVYTCDPEQNKPVSKIEKKFFDNIWFDFAGKNNEKIIWRWMMAIEKIR